MEKMSSKPKMTSLFRLIAIFEKERFNIFTGALWFTLVVFLRFVLEFTFFSVHKETNTILVGSFYQVYHQFAFYLTVFAFGVLIIILFSGERAKKVANPVLLMFPIILLAPILDKLVFNRTEVYRYAFPGFYLENIQTLFMQSRMAPGIAVQLIIIILLSCIYVFIKTLMLNASKQLKSVIPKAILKSFLTLAALYFVLGIIGTLPVLVHDELRETAYFTESSLQLILFIGLFIFGALVFSVIVNVTNRRIFLKFLKNIRISWLMFFVILAGLGVVANQNTIFNDNYDEALVQVNDIPYAFVALMTLTFGGIYALMIHKIKSKGVYEKRVKKYPIYKGINQNYSKQAAFLFAYTCFGLGLLLGWVSTVLTVAFLFLMWFYPLHNKISRVNKLGTSIFGASSSIAFFIGYFTTNRTTEILIGNYSVLVPLTNAQPTMILILPVIAIFCFSSLIVSLMRRKHG